MPLNEFDSPYPLGSPEERDYRNALIRSPALAATQVLPTWLGMLAPRSTDEHGDTHWALPGLVTSGYGALGTAGPNVANWAVRKATGYNLNIPHAPGAEAALQSAEGNERWADSIVPHMTAQTPEEQGIVDIARGGAAFSVPGFGAEAALARLPKVAQVAAHVVAPGLGTTARGAVIGSTLTGAAGAYEEHKTQQTQQELDAIAAAHDKTNAPAQPAQPARPATAATAVTPTGSAFDQPMDLTQPDTSHTVAQPAMGAPVTLPFATSSGQAQATSNQPGASDAKYDTLAEFGRPDIKIKVPDFSTEGSTGLTFGEAAMGGMAATAAAVLAMRIGGKVLDPLIKTVTGEGDQINTLARRMEHNRRLDAIDNGAALNATDPNKPGATRGEAPLPGKAGTVGTRMAQSAWDQNRVLTEFTKATAPNSGVAKQMEARIATVNNSTPLMNRITEQMATGVNLANGGSIVPKLKETLQQYAGLKPEQVTRLERGLYAGDELDTRAIKFNQAKNTPGASIADEDLRHNYRTTHSDELRTAYVDMMVDPQTAAVAKSIYQMQRAHMFEARDMGRITSQDMRRIIDQRPRQIPSTNAEGVVEHALGAREVNTTGWDAPPTKAIDAVTQHYGKLYAELNRNTMLHDILKSAEQYQKANPTAARVVTRLTDAKGNPIEPPSGPAVGRRITTYSEGVPHTWEIDNTDLYRAVQGNMAKTGLILDTADTLRRLYQGGTTGVAASVLSQRPFSFINLNRNILQIGTDRVPGTTFGMLDKGVNYLSGGRFGLRTGVDPTQWIGSYAEATKGVGAVTAKIMADGLRNPNNYVNKTVRGVLGDTFADGWAARAEQRWLKSNAAQRKAEGVSGAGAGGTYERPIYNVSRSNRSGYSGLHHAVQGVFHPNDVHLPFTKVRIPGTKGAVATYIDMRSWLREIHQEISEGANSYYWKGMRDNPNISREQRVYQTRQVVGDPSVRGTGKAAEWATHYIPWVNPSIQDAVRMMRNLRDNPVAFTLGTMTRLGTAAAASLASAMLGGNRHLNMLGHLMSTHDRASNITFFHDPNDEHNYTQISMPQRDRMLYPGVLEGIAYGSGAFGLHQDEDMYHRVLHAALDLFNHHISHSTAVSSREGLADFAGIFQAPPPVQAIAALAGKQFNEPLGQVMQNYSEGQPLSSGIITDATGRPSKSGQAGSGYVSSDDNKWFRNVMKSVLGLSGDAYLKATHAYERYQVSHDLANAFGGVLTDAGQSWRDQAPFGNMIWGNNVKLAARNPLEEVNRVAYEKLKALPSPTAVQNTGLSRRNGVLLSEKDAPVNADPRIIQLVSIAHNYRTQIDKAVQPQIMDIRKQLKEVDDDAHFTAQDKRKIRNDLVTKANELESKKNLMISQMHAAMEWAAGGKHVNINTFDPKKGMDQFHD